VYDNVNFQLPELLHLKAFDIMFHEAVEGGENAVMIEHKNLAGGKRRK
jgi:hypothetical protein